MDVCGKTWWFGSEADDLEVAVAKGFTPGSAVSQDPLRSWAEKDDIGSHAELMLRSLKGERGQ